MHIFSHCMTSYTTLRPILFLWFSWLCSGSWWDVCLKEQFDTYPRKVDSSGPLILFIRLHYYRLLFIAYLLTLPLFAGVSRVRALSPTWTGSHARETLISRTHLFLQHDLPPNKKIKYNKILTYILRSIFLEIPHLELARWWKTPRDTNGKGV